EEVDFGYEFYWEGDGLIPVLYVPTSSSGATLRYGADFGKSKFWTEHVQGSTLPLWEDGIDLLDFSRLIPDQPKDSYWINWLVGHNDTLPLTPGRPLLVPSWNVFLQNNGFSSWANFWERMLPPLFGLVDGPASATIAHINKISTDLFGLPFDFSRLPGG